MDILENIVIKVVMLKMKHDFKLDEKKEIEVSGVTEYKDIPYENRSGKTLYMDIFKL